jgi:soluble lytic murein transglycosylase-like protein
MQINSSWLSTFAHYGYSRKDLQFNPCKNVMAGTWILANSIANGDTLWSRIGNYHSHTPKRNASYQNNIYKNYQKISVVLAAE